MHYRRFGQTNLQLSVFSLGTMRLATPETAERTIARAIALGINHLETAPSYGNSEVYLGQALQHLAPPRSQVHITTKLLPTLDADAAERSIDHSLERLQLDYIDALALHGINTRAHLSAVLAPTGSLVGAQRACRDGRVRHLGFSTHGPLELILDTIATGKFAFVNLHYSYFFQRHARAIAAAHQRDLGIFIISPADKGGLLHTPPPALTALCEPLSPLELNYRFLLSQPAITTLSSGPAHPGELEALLAVANQTQPLTAAEQALLDRLEQHQSEALGSSLCQQCYACLPCPEDIHIPEVLRLRNLAVAYDMTQFGQYRYGMFEQAGHWFPGRRADRCTDCGDCLPRCPANLTIPALLRDAHAHLGGKPRRRLWE